MFAALGLGGGGADAPSPTLRLGRSDEPHIADGRLPLGPAPSPEPPPSPSSSPPPSPPPGLPNLSGFFGDIGHFAQAALAPLRTLGQPLIAPAPSTLADLHHRDPYAAARQRQQQRQAPPAPPAVADEPDLSTSGPPAPTHKSGLARFDHRPPSAGSSLPPHPSSEPAAQSLATSNRPAQRKRPKSRKPKLPPEQLVIVRPPPTKHALSYNLQVQLVSRRARDRGNTASSQASGSNVGANVSMESLSSRTSTIPPDQPAEDEATGRRPSESGQSRLSSDAPSRRASISSNRSQQSVDTLSGSGFGASLSDSSGMSATSHRSRVIPLYNLTCHSLLPSFISDSGTDERVAKVSKRGHIELEGLAVLEPAELVVGVNDVETVLRSRPAARTPYSAPAHSKPLELVNEVSHGSLDRDEKSSPGQTTSPSISLNGIPTKVAEAGDLSPHGHERRKSAMRPASMQGTPSPSVGQVPRSQTAVGVISAPPKSGNKFVSGFKKLLAPRVPARPLALGDAKKADPPRTLPAPEAEEAMSTSLSFDAAFGGTLLGSVLGDGVPMWPVEKNSRRLGGYVWTVRRWLRKAEPQPAPPPVSSPVLKSKGSQASFQSGSSADGTFAQVWSRFSTPDRTGGCDPPPLPATVPIRFEWTKDPSRTRRARAAAAGQLRAPSMTRPASRNLPTSPPRRPGALPNVDGTASAPVSPATRPVRLNGASLDAERGRAVRRATGAGAPGSPRPGARSSMSTDTADDGCESDPEDSETPWRCALVLGPKTRVPLAMLTPTPHHPRLVAHLTVPFPLPNLSSSGLGPDRGGLSPEELKDVASVTALHLVVREGFGAMAKAKKA